MLLGTPKVAAVLEYLGTHDFNCGWFEKGHCQTPLRAEMFAILLAFKLASAHRWRKIKVFSDSLIAKRSLYHEAEVPWEIVDIVLDARYLL